jgi:hypothetical protein
MANEQERPADTSSNKKKPADKHLYWIGVSGIVISIAIYIVGALLGTGTESSWLCIVIAVSVLLISVPIMAIGWGRIMTSIPVISLATFVCGILGILSLWSLTLFSMVFSPSAIIFGMVALVMIKRNPSLGGLKTAIAGLILGVIALVIIIVVALNPVY